jgi:capsular polysaccharide export protein
VGLAEAAEQRGIPLIRVEDGFVRSVGLGSDFIPAASLVLDSRGMAFRSERAQRS